MNLLKKLIAYATPLLFVAFCYYTYSFAKKDIRKITAEVMNYPMQVILERCKEDHGYTDADMSIIEREFKRFMILSIVSEDGGPGMFNQDVDNLWHTFLLFTKEYADFCEKCSGRFIHHAPKPSMTTTPEKAEFIHEYFLSFVDSYEKTFAEEIHPIWLLDMSEDIMKASVL